VLFGTAGVAAGYLGVPRRVLDVTYAGEAPAAWGTLMSIVGVGGLLMTVALGLYVLVLALNLLPVKRGAGAAYPEVRWGGEVALDARAWTGPLAIAVLVGLMVVFSVAAFELMKALPLEAIGGAAH
jgi:cytochrome c oxidase subunit I